MDQTSPARGSVRIAPGQAQTGSGARRPRLDQPDQPGHWWHLHPFGLVCATLFAVLSMTPSLLPRTWLFQGVVSGVSGAAGYSVGVLLGATARRSARWRRLAEQVGRRSPGWADRALWAVLAVAAPVALGVALAAGARWQQDLAALMGMERAATLSWLGAGPLLVVVAAVLLAAARVLRWLAGRLAAALHRWVRLPRQLARAVGVVLVGLSVVTVVNDVLLRQALSAADDAFRQTNDQTPADVQQPQDASRSGSPASLVRWDTLGQEGRKFVAGGRSGGDLAVAGGRPARSPVRAYVGLDSAPSAQDRADLAVAELERTGAFDRAVLLVVTTTGTGWIDSANSDSLELIYAGDTAIVATQYSYLPSWISFLADRSRARQAGRLLFDTVAARVEQLPDDQRPRLLVSGESLGSQGSEEAFTTLADIRAHCDGVLWIGPPNSNRIWSSLVQRRDPGSRQVAPVYGDGLVVRFGVDPAQIARTPEPWLFPRVLYLQNPSDPIVWWSPALLLRRPDWLVEPRGTDVLPAMSWYPVVTFWQVTADMANSTSVPDGHGHRYGEVLLDGWLAIAPPPGWTEADTARARDVFLT